MSVRDDAANDTPLDAFIAEMAECGFRWVKRIGHVNVHIFEHDLTHEVMPIPVERDVVKAVYVNHARQRCRQIRSDSGSPD